MPKGPRTVALAGLVVVACVTAALWRAFPGDLVFFQRDILGYWLPHVELFRRVVHAGELPLWNSYVGFGAPLLPEPSCGFLYPLTWLVLVLEPADYYRLFVVSHALLAGVGASFLARQLGVRSVPAAVAGGVYAISGPVLSAASLFHHFAGAAWMPWVLAAFIALRVRPSCRTSTGLSLAVAGQLLAGSADLCLMTALLGVVWFVWHEFGRPDVAMRRFAVGLIAALATGAAIGSAQWALTLEIAREGARATLPLDARSYWSVHPGSLFELFTPQLLSRLPLGEGLRTAFFEGREPLLASLFLGVPALGLAILGASVAPARSRGFVLSAFAGTLLLCLGHFTPAFGALHSLPPFSFIRYPAKYLLPLALSSALLTALGCESWLGLWQDRERRGARRAMVGLGLAALWLGGMAVALGYSSRLPAGWLDGSRPHSFSDLRTMLAGEATFAALAIALFGLRLRGSSRAEPLLGAMAALVFADLALAGQGVNAMASRALLEMPPPLARAIPTGSRVYVAEPPRPVTARRFATSPLAPLGRVGSALAALETLAPPQAARFGLFGSHDGDFTGLAPPLQSEFVNVIRGHEDWPVGQRCLRLGGVDYVVDVGGGG